MLEAAFEGNEELVAKFLQKGAARLVFTIAEVIYHVLDGGS